MPDRGLDHSDFVKAERYIYKARIHAFLLKKNLEVVRGRYVSVSRARVLLRLDTLQNVRKNKIIALFHTTVII